MMLFVDQPFVDYNRRIAVGLLRAPHVGKEWTLTISRPPVSAKEMTELLDRTEPDGVAVLDLSEDCLKLILARGIPCVSLSVDKFPSCGLPVVQTDDIAIGTLAADHFLQRGFRHFASVGSPSRVQFQARVKGFAARLKKRNLQCTEFWHEDCDSNPLFDLKELPSGIHDWLVRLPKPCAIFCVNDTTGAAVVRLSAQLGLAVPDEVAVLGVDNSSLFCLTVWPHLSSVHPPFEEIGRRGAEILREGNNGTRRIVEKLPPIEVASRGSTATESSLDPLVADALTFIRKNIESPFRIRDLREAADVSAPTLAARFKAALGHTAIEEVRRQRVEHAKKLLLSHLPIGEVARRSGFTSPTHFCKAFQELTGKTPSAFRSSSAAV